jgi:hypothetical protein
MSVICNLPLPDELLICQFLNYIPLAIYACAVVHALFQLLSVGERRNANSLSHEY